MLRGLQEETGLIYGNLVLDGYGYNWKKTLLLAIHDYTISLNSGLEVDNAHTTKDAFAGNNFFSFQRSLY